MRENRIFPGLRDWDASLFRASLVKCGFHPKGLESIGIPERWRGSSMPRAALAGHLPAGSPIETLIRLFILGDPVDGALALRALGDAIHELPGLGLLETGGGNVRSIYQICPVEDGWIAADFPAARTLDHPDFVMGIGPSSIQLATLAQPRPGGRALELASGIGWLAGHLSKTGMSVVATDLNSRALDLGEFSAKLRNIGGVDFRAGEGYSAVKGERFDLIVSNPPYVQSPGGPMVYREAPAGDSICARLLRDTPSHLSMGGIAVVLINWTHAGDSDWKDAPLSWVDPVGVRRWLFQSDCLSPADYAWKWISSDPAFSGEEALMSEMKRWLSHFQATGARRVSGGFMVLQRCEPGTEWTRADSRSAESVMMGAGGELARVVSNTTWLETSPDLLETRFLVPDGVSAEVRMSLGSGGWGRSTIRLTSASRLSYDGQVDENILRLLELLRAGNTPAAMVEEIRAKPEFAAVPDLADRIASLVHELVYHGVILPG